MPDIMHHIRIGAPREQVYEVLTTAEDVRNWWTRDADLESKIGGRAEFRFYQGESVTRVSIDELVPPARVGWTAVSANAPGGWAGTVITFDLQAEGSDTVLSFAHRGFAQADEGYAMCTTGWAYYLVSLRQYVETGQGGPHPDIDFARIIR